MPRNDGKSSEELFEDHLTAGGKTTYWFRPTDTRDLIGQARGRGMRVAATTAKKNPSDYVVTENGEMFYAEAKSCNNATSFPFSNFEANQLGGMRQQIAAGGNYFVFIHNLLTDTWYKVPAAVIMATRETKQSIKWTELETFKTLLRKTSQ